MRLTPSQIETIRQAAGEAFGATVHAAYLAISAYASTRLMPDS